MFENSGRRLLLIQAEIRLRHIKRQEARRLRAYQEIARRQQGELEAEKELAAAAARHQHLAVYITEWEQRMESIARLTAVSEEEDETQQAGGGGGGDERGSCWLKVPPRVEAKLAIAPGRHSQLSTVGSTVIYMGKMLRH